MQIRFLATELPHLMSLLVTLTAKKTPAPTPLKKIGTKKLEVPCQCPASYCVLLFAPN